ncbi:hypothetical protein J6R97_01315 [bacterium]|nr:hypothetical protein [bacterium]
MVSWQNTNYYKDLKNYEKSSGYTTAEMNYLNNPNGIHNPFVATFAPVAQSLFTMLPQFMELKSSNNNDDKAEIAKNIKSDIDKIFEKYNKGDKDSKDPIDNIDEIEGLLQARYNETNSSIESLEENNSNLEKSNQNINNFLVNFDSNIDQIDNEINACKGSIKALKSLPNNDLIIQDYERKINELKEKKAELIKQKAENEKQLEENLSQIVKNNELLNEFKSIQKDIKDLKELSKQLKKAEGKEAIESLTNNETNNIVKLLSEYNKAKQGSDLDKINKTKSELVEALKAYNGDNKTFLNLKQQFRIA